MFEEKIIEDGYSSPLFSTNPVPSDIQERVKVLQETDAAQQVAANELATLGLSLETIKVLTGKEPE